MTVVQLGGRSGEGRSHRNVSLTWSAVDLETCRETRDVVLSLVCVTTITMPVHLHGTNFALFLLHTRRCYDAETSAILLLLKRAFA